MLSIALMVFLVAYAVFEVPSNYLLKELRPGVSIFFLLTLNICHESWI